MAKRSLFTKNFSDESTLITALRQEDSRAFNYLYTTFYPGVLRYVVAQGGTEDDAQEVFQDAIIELLEKLGDPNFVLRVKTGTYLFAIAKYKWWEMNRRRGRHVPFEADPHYSPRDETDPLDDLPPVANSLNELVTNSADEQDALPSIDVIIEFIKNMGNPCADILLDHYIAGISLIELAEDTGTSDGTMRKRAYDCREKVKRHFSR